MFYSSSSIQNALTNSDIALISVIKESLSSRCIKKRSKVSEDYLLKLVQEKKASRDYSAENLYHGLSTGKGRDNILALM